MSASRIIARRYLFSRKHVTLVSTLTVISVAGVTVGTALLIVVLSVFNGFFEVIKDMLLANDPDLRIESAEARTFTDEPGIRDMLDQIPEIRIQSPFLQGKVLIAGSERRDQVVTVKGVYPELLAEYADMDVLLRAGALDLEVRGGRPGMLMHGVLAHGQRLQTGDEISLLSASGMQRSLTQFTGPRTSRFQIRGTYSLQQIIDEPVIYIHMDAAERLFNERQQLSGIDIRLDDHHSAEDVKARLQQKLGDSFRVQSWYDLQKPLYDVMNLEKWGAYFILMIIVLVAVLNIVGSLTMIVIQKQRDIGLLRSIGFSKKQVMAIFLMQGWYIGLTGCTLGGLAGLALAWLQGTYGIIKLAGAESFIISAYPVQVLWHDVVFVLGASLFLCVAASLYPSLRAASIHPARALRGE